MPDRFRWIVTVVLVALVTAACSNSEDGTATGDGPATEEEGTEAEGAGDEAEAERDTFVEISGVPGVSDDEIAFSVIGTKENNPLGTCILDCYVEGIQAYFDFRNGDGGVYGRELVIGDVLDDELAQNQTRAIEVISSDDTFGVFNATLLATGWGDLHDAGVPTFAWNIHATEFADRTSIFGHFGAACAECAGRSTPFLVEQAGATRVASLGYGISENSKVCASSIRSAVERYSGDIGGAEVVYFNDDLAFGLPNGIGPEVSEMKTAGVEFIASCMDLNGMKTLAQELDRQQMQDVVMSHPNTYNHPFVAENAAIFEGDFVTPQFLPFESQTGNEALTEFKEIMEANGSELSELAAIGWVNADTAFTGLLAAGPDFDREKVIGGLNRLTEYDAGGLIVPVDWTRQHSPPTPEDPTLGYARECFTPVRVVDGAFETVADPATPWFCWDNSTRDWSDPEQVAFGAS